MCKSSMRYITNDINLNTSGYIIEQSKKVKILAIYLTPGLCNEAGINYTISKVNNRT